MDETREDSDRAVLACLALHAVLRGRGTCCPHKKDLSGQIGLLN